MIPCRLVGSNEWSWKTFCLHFPISTRLHRVIAQKRTIWKMKHLKLFPKIFISTNVSQVGERCHRSQLAIFLFVVCPCVLEFSSCDVFSFLLVVQRSSVVGETRECTTGNSRRSWSAEADDCIVPEDSERTETFSPNLHWSFSSIRSFPGMLLSFLTSYYTNTSLVLLSFIFSFVHLLHFLNTSFSYDCFSYVFTFFRNFLRLSLSWNLFPAFSSLIPSISNLAYSFMYFYCFCCCLFL